MPFDQSTGVASVKLDDDLRVVLFAADDELELRQRYCALAPRANLRGHFRFCGLLWDLDRELREVTGLQLVLAMFATLAASPLRPLPAAAPAALTSSRPRTAVRRTILNGARRFNFRRLRRLAVDLGLDHHALHTAEEAALFENDVVGELIALDIEHL